MKIAVFCGSSMGVDPVYAQATAELGRFFGEQGIDVVYGGGNVGLMGTVAQACLDVGGNVYGVIPEALQEKEIAHPSLTELKVVADMHERKAEMARLADAFVALPGGAGTLEEIFEAWTWAQLGYHTKPCAFYNTNGYYEPLKDMISTMTTSGFLKPDYADMLIHTDNPQDLLSAIQSYVSPRQKWS